jgi:hypothetical protein
MARYLAVGAVRREGQRLAPLAPGDAPPPVAPGLCLVAIVNNGEWQSAIDVTFPAFYERVLRRFREGVWKAMELYALDAERAAALEDGRRVLMNGQPVLDPGRR